MNTQRLPQPYDPPPGGADTRRLGPWQKFTRRRYMLFHLGFTLRLIGRCLGDPRVAAGSKVLFLGVTGLLLFMLMVPEAGADFMALLLPVAGPVLDLFGIPFEGAVDWGFLVLAIGGLMSLFPPEVLQQHIWELKGGGNWLPGADTTAAQLPPADPQGPNGPPPPAPPGPPRW